MCRDNSHHLLKYLFCICLYSMLTSLLNISKLLQMVNFLFSAYFGGHFCNNSNGKSQINLRLLPFGYCKDKLVKKQFLYFNLIGGPKKPPNARRSKLFAKVLSRIQKSSLAGKALSFFRGQFQGHSDQLWFATLLHPKMHSHTKFKIPISNNIRDTLWTRLF